MSEANFKSMQSLHESLLQKQQKISEENPQEFIKEVREYIEQAKKAGSNIFSTRERDQIRANLRYWANYVYSIEKNFPDTELAPSSVLGNQSIWTTAVGKLSLLVLGIAALIGIGNLLFGGGYNPMADETPTNVSPTDSIQTTSTVEPVTPASHTPTPLFVGSDVVLTSPENGESVSPKIIFKGAYTNLKPESTIHMLLIKSDKLYPVTNYYTITEEASRGEWEIEAALYQNPEDLEQAENLAVVPGACFDNSCREILANSTAEGITIDKLPSQFSFTLYRDSSRVIYRNAYRAIQEMRLVFPFFDGDSYDIYTSKPDGSDPIQITDSPTIYEEAPSLSPDGTKIVYVHNSRSIHIMDSNGQNDREIINGGQNILENPQWAPDSEYISYAMGVGGQSGRSQWSIHTYHLTTGDDQIVSGDPEILANRYSTWFPNENRIVFDARSGNRSLFSQVSLSTLGNFSPFFDLGEPDQEVIQPSIRIFGEGYLLTYTIVNIDSTFSHDIFAVYTEMDLDEQISIDGSPVRLTRTSGGADYPILEPNSNFIYYVRPGYIFKVEFSIQDGNITLRPGTISDDGEHFGDLVIETGTVTDSPSFDINFMNTFFPIP